MGGICEEGLDVDGVGECVVQQVVEGLEDHFVEVIRESSYELVFAVICTHTGSESCGN